MVSPSRSSPSWWRMPVSGNTKMIPVLSRARKIEDSARSLADHGIRSVKVRDDVVVIDGKKNGIRKCLDGPLVQLVVPMRRIFPAPTVLMKLDDQIVSPCLGQDALANDIDAGRFVGGSKQYSRLRGVQAKRAKNVTPRRLQWPEQGVELWQTDLVYGGCAHGARQANLVRPVVAFHKNLVTGARLLAKIAIQDVLDAGTVVDKAQQSRVVTLRIAHCIASNYDVISASIVGNFQSF